MNELSDIVKIALPAMAGTHLAVTTMRAYMRYQVTRDDHPDKGFLERLPRCFARRMLDIETVSYTALIGTAAAIIYYAITSS